MRREFWIKENKIFPCAAYQQRPSWAGNGPSPLDPMIHVREVLTGEISITRDDLIRAIKETLQGDEHMFGAMHYANEVWNTLGAAAHAIAGREDGK